VGPPEGGVGAGLGPASVPRPREAALGDEQSPGRLRQCRLMPDPDAELKKSRAPAGLVGPARCLGPAVGGPATRPEGPGRGSRRRAAGRLQGPAAVGPGFVASSGRPFACPGGAGPVQRLERDRACPSGRSTSQGVLARPVRRRSSGLPVGAWGGQAWQEAGCGRAVGVRR
jgi:hypothetical protein